MHENECITKEEINMSGFIDISDVDKPYMNLSRWSLYVSA